MWYNINATQIAYVYPMKGKYFGKKCFLSFLIPSSVRHLCSNNERDALFRCVPSRSALFYILIGGYMNKDFPKKVIDVTGVELTPGEPTVCLGNGEQGFECCCDECDYFLLCFPGFDSKSETINKAEIHQTLLWQKQRKGTFDISISKAYAITFREVEKCLSFGERWQPKADGGVVKVSICKRQSLTACGGAPFTQGSLCLYKPICLQTDGILIVVLIKAYEALHL